MDRYHYAAILDHWGFNCFYFIWFNFYLDSETSLKQCIWVKSDVAFRLKSFIYSYQTNKILIFDILKTRRRCRCRRKWSLCSHLVHMQLNNVFPLQNIVWFIYPSTIKACELQESTHRIRAGQQLIAEITLHYFIRFGNVKQSFGYTPIEYSRWANNS